MTTSQNSQFITRSRGQFRIDLRAAVNALPHTEPAANLTFGELARAYLASHYDESDMQLRKWIDLLGSRSAWSVTADELTRAGHAMLANGYSPSTVNRNLSQVGSVYKFAKKNLLASGPSLYFSMADKALNRILQIMKELGLTPKHRVGTLRSTSSDALEFEKFMAGNV